MSKGKSVTAQEYADIMNVYALYNLCSDAGDAEGYAACFTDDGVLRIDNLGVRIEGRAAFVEFKKKDAAGRGGRYRRHWNGSIHLEKLDDGTVRGRCYLLAFNGVPGSLPELADAATYVDTLRQQDGEWRFAERVLTMDGTTFKPPG